MDPILLLAIGAKAKEERRVRIPILDEHGARGLYSKSALYGGETKVGELDLSTKPILVQDERFVLLGIV